MVIGVSHHTAPLAMRERFWIGESRRYEVLRQLQGAEGVEEVIILSTRCRTEFLLWASEPRRSARSSWAEPKIRRKSLVKNLPSFLAAIAAAGFICCRLLASKRPGTPAN